MTFQLFGTSQLTGETVLRAADDTAAAIERGRNTRVYDILNELDRLEAQDQHEHEYPEVADDA